MCANLLFLDLGVMDEVVAFDGSFVGDTGWVVKMYLRSHVCGRKIDDDLTWVSLCLFLKNWKIDESEEPYVSERGWASYTMALTILQRLMSSLATS